MAEAVVTEPSSAALAPAQLAALHGLRVAGDRPDLITYTRWLWRYRHFISTFASAKNLATFTTARLGQLWHVLTPLTNAAVYFLIFGVILNTQHGINNFVAYLCTGIFVFGYTQQATTAGVKAITDHLGLIRALQFPRACLPISATLTQLQQMAATMGVLMLIIVVSGEPLSFKWLLLIPVLLLQSVFNAGLALAVARLGSKIIDLKQIMPFVLRTWLYGSGVFYSLASVSKRLPEWASVILHANPLLVYIELAREALLEQPPPTGQSLTQMWLLAIVWAVAIGLGGYVYFWRGEKEYGRG
jgi:teichoic acid transport system permease protein